MYMNDKGWPVVAPYRYTDIQQEEVKKNEVAGSYKIVNHGKDISAELKTSVIVTLEKNGKISGDVKGSWSLDKDGTATLKADGVTYTGVFTNEWDELAQKNVVTFSVLSDSGVALWGSQMEELKDKEVVAAVKKISI